MKKKEGCGPGEALSPQEAMRLRSPRLIWRTEVVLLTVEEGCYKHTELLPQVRQISPWSLSSQSFYAHAPCAHWLILELQNHLDLQALKSISDCCEIQRQSGVEFTFIVLLS